MDTVAEQVCDGSRRAKGMLALGSWHILDVRVPASGEMVRRSA